MNEYTQYTYGVSTTTDAPPVTTVAIAPAFGDDIFWQYCPQCLRTVHKHIGESVGREGNQYFCFRCQQWVVGVSYKRVHEIEEARWVEYERAEECVLAKLPKELPPTNE